MSPRYLIWLFAVMTGCLHTSEARQKEIYDQVSKTNQASEQAAYAKVVDNAHATPLVLPLEHFVLTEPIDECTPEYREQMKKTRPVPTEIWLNRTDSKPRIVVSCDELRIAMWKATPLEGKTESGDPVLLVAAFPLAEAPDKSLLSVRGYMKSVRTWKIRVPGSCNEMPSPPFLPNSVSFYVLPNRHASEVRPVDFVFEGESIETKCDSPSY